MEHHSAGSQNTLRWEKIAIFDWNRCLSRKRYEIGPRISTIPAFLHGQKCQRPSRPACHQASVGRYWLHALLQGRVLEVCFGTNRRTIRVWATRDSSTAVTALMINIIDITDHSVGINAASRVVRLAQVDRRINARRQKLMFDIQSPFGEQRRKVESVVLRLLMTTLSRTILYDILYNIFSGQQ